MSRKKAIIILALFFSLAGCKKEVNFDNTEVFKLDGQWTVRMFKQVPNHPECLTYKFFDHYTSEGDKFDKMLTGGRMATRLHVVKEMVEEGRTYRKYCLRLKLKLWMDTFSKAKRKGDILETVSQFRTFTGRWQEKPFKRIVLWTGGKKYKFRYEFHGENQLTLYSSKTLACRPNTVIVLRKAHTSRPVK